ncbi:MAG: anhydro-N-acetylmuramic acid kinase [Ferruginibacter sp.]
MNENITKLAAISSKQERIIIGLMSGTSMDGLDVTVCRVKGTGFGTTILIEEFETVPYETGFKKTMAATCFKEQVSLQELTLLHAAIGDHHADIINALLAKWNIQKGNVDLIASHGQTVYHAPAHQHRLPQYGHATLQIGEADRIAVKTGIITVSDFRQKNIAGGGEGAPLAAYGDLLLFAEKDRDVVMLNIGGIANFSFLPAAGTMICSDIGPGNTLMDQWMTLNFPGKYFDENASVAMRGTVNPHVLAALKAHSFFSAPFPKTTGPELFNLDVVHNAITVANAGGISAEDIMATLNVFTADMICEAIRSVTGGGNYKLYISGGGMHNPLLLQHLKAGLHKAEWHDTVEKHIDPDAKEAILFALLANECVAGNPEVFKGISEKMPAVSMGKISFPG